MNGVETSAEEYGKRISAKNTKVMVVSQEAAKRLDLVVGGQKVEQVQKFMYLGS